MNKTFRKGKSRVWHKTFGKPFLARRLIKLSKVAQAAFVGIQHITTIKSSSLSSQDKAKAIAEAVINASKGICCTIKGVDKK